ncbi:MAG: acyltransferase family protein [Flavobacteriaceae bacterium]
MKKRRNYNLDTLRAVATILVVLLHVSASFVTQSSDNDTYDFNFWFANVVDSFSRISVPLFVMISGYFLYEKIEGSVVFYKKRASRILIPLIFWTIFYLFFNFIIKGNYNAKDLFYSVLKGTPFYHLWYIYMLIGLYLFIPVLKKHTLNMSHKNKWILAIGFMLVGFLLSLISEFYKMKTVFLLWFIKYIGYFMMGSLVVKASFLNRKLALFLYIISCISIAILTFYTLSLKKSLYFYNYLSPFVIIASVSFYYYFSQLKIKESRLSKIAHLTFGVYLIHPAIEFVFKKVLRHFDLYVTNSLVGISIQFFVIFGLSYSIIFIMYKNKFLRKLI